ncbi:EndoU domain-containing protein [Pseudomonas chlororaphis]|uniref:EndoU domain-containing protein n=1 Tax=Pseudomonas chlororaphis TaxID=587753 RepID=UPI00138A1653|nr:EndoU domain-containing protein [Pseudomonas chlororaphis]
MNIIYRLSLVSALVLTVASCSSITSLPTTGRATANSCNVTTTLVTTPPTNEEHIFCGEVDLTAKPPAAKGFHSAPNGATPSTIALKANSTITLTATPSISLSLGPDHSYTLKDFEVISGTTKATKNISSMFPNTCTADQVLKSIEYAASQTAIKSNKCKSPAWAECGPSAPTPIPPTDVGKYCLAGNKVFSIGTKIEKKPTTKINTAFPAE